MLGMNPLKFIYRVIFFAAAILSLYRGAIAATLAGKAANTPWSGYWWPTTTAKMVFGYHRSMPAPSPLNKYDLYQYGNYPGMATSWELSNGYDPNGEPWYGYCDAWASAAIHESYDIKPSAKKGIFFRVGDKKGLLTLAHVDDLKVYLHSGGALAFHSALIQYIGQDKVAIMADLDNSEEVWSYPIYEYIMNVSSYPDYDLIECRISYASDFVAPDFVGTKTLSSIYTYKLFKVGDNYTSGQWSGSSVDDHPDALWITIPQESANPGLDIETVRAIAKSEDDDTEGNMALLPGHYALLINPGESDTVGFETVAGTSLSLKFGLDYQNYTDLIKPSYTFIMNGDIVDTGTISEDIETIDFDVTSGGNATFTISADGQNNYPDMVHFYFDAKFQENQYLLNTFSNSTWNGIVLNNDSPDTNRVMATFVSEKNGMPIYSLPIQTGGDTRVVFSNLFDHSKAVTDYFYGGEPMIMRISSQNPIHPIYLKGTSEGMFGPAASDNAPLLASKIVMPEINMTYDFSKSVRLTLFNPSDQDLSVHFDYFSESGSKSSNYNLTLNANRLVRYLDGGFPGNLNINGWALLSVQGGEGICGDVTIYEKQMMDEIPLLTSASALYLPLLATLSGWQTQMTLFNPHDQQNQVAVGLMNSGAKQSTVNLTLEAYEKKTMNLNGDVFSLGQNEINGAWMILNSDYPIAGLVSYQFSDHSKASLPLLGADDFASVLRLRYAASDAKVWFTSMMLLNPNQAQSEVTIYGYDTNGGLISQKNVAIGGENIFPASLQSLFDENYIDVRSVDIQAQNAIAGIALYGTRDMQLLTGIVLNP